MRPARLLPLAGLVAFGLFSGCATSGGLLAQRRFVGRVLRHGTPFQEKQGRWWCTAFCNANVPPPAPEQARGADLSATAQTINEQGLTLVPREVRIADDGDVIIRVKDPDDRNPGPDEAQRFDPMP